MNRRRVDPGVVSLRSTFASVTFPIGRVRIFHPVPSNLAGIHSRCSSHHPSCCSSRRPSCCSSHRPSTGRHPICRARSAHPVPSNPAGIHSMSDGDVEHRRARVFQPRLHQCSKSPRSFSSSVRMTKFLRCPVRHISKRVAKTRCLTNCVSSDECRFSLRLDGGVRLGRLRQAFPQIARRRGGVRGVVTRLDEDGNGDADQFRSLTLIYGCDGVGDNLCSRRGAEYRRY